MNIEENIFERKRINSEKLLAYGFKLTKGQYLFNTEILNGDFKVSIVVNKDLKVMGFVKDIMNDEEYLPLRMKNQNGAYVNEVRSAYESLLNDIAKECSENLPFVSDQANRISELIYKKYHIKAGFPWKNGQHKDNGVFRHADTDKWFGLIMHISYGLLLKNSDQDKKDVMNLKTKDVNFLSLKKGIYPAYHMNHDKWLSVVLDESLSDEEVMKLVEASFMETM